MKPVYQTIFGGSDRPIEEWGNCVAACIASILELPLDCVPDNRDENKSWYIEMEQWLNEKGLGLVIVPYEPTKETFPENAYIMAATKSTTLKNPDDGHLVVIYNGQIVHDPNPKAESTGEVEELWFLIPLDPAKVLDGEHRGMP